MKLLTKDGRELYPYIFGTPNVDGCDKIHCKDSNGNEVAITWQDVIVCFGSYVLPPNHIRLRKPETKKTLRLMVTLDCNFNCSYCCNKLPEVNSRFIHKSLDLIDFKQYDSICITGGEPFLCECLVKELIQKLSPSHKIYMYSNGNLISRNDAEMLFKLGLNGLNIGIHPEQEDSVVNLKKFADIPGVVFYVENIYNAASSECRHFAESQEISKYKNVKFWRRDDCFNNVDTEDWVVLTN